MFNIFKKELTFLQNRSSSHFNKWRETRKVKKAIRNNLFPAIDKFYYDNREEIFNYKNVVLTMDWITHSLNIPIHNYFLVEEYDNYYLLGSSFTPRLCKLIGIEWDRFASSIGDISMRFEDNNIVLHNNSKNTVHDKMVVSKPKSFGEEYIMSTDCYNKVIEIKN